MGFLPFFPLPCSPLLPLLPFVKLVIVITVVWAAVSSGLRMPMLAGCWLPLQFIVKTERPSWYEPWASMICPSTSSCAPGCMLSPEILIVACSFAGADRTIAMLNR